jgi:hypothetical protein
LTRPRRTGFGVGAGIGLRRRVGRRHCSNLQVSKTLTARRIVGTPQLGAVCNRRSVLTDRHRGHLGADPALAGPPAAGTRLVQPSAVHSPGRGCPPGCSPVGRRRGDACCLR